MLDHDDQVEWKFAMKLCYSEDVFAGLWAKAARTKCGQRWTIYCCIESSASSELMFVIV
jgi:hypothetical protein